MDRGTKSGGTRLYILFVPLIIILLLSSIYFSSFAVGESHDVATLNDTTISIAMPENIAQDESFNILATLADQDGNPISDMTIEFFMYTTFTKVKIGEKNTVQGAANIAHTIPYAPFNDTIQIEAVFAGNSTLEANSIIGTISVDSQPSEEIPPDYGYMGIMIVVLLIVASLWGVLGYVFYQLNRIREDGAKQNKSAEGQNGDG